MAQGKQQPKFERKHATTPEIIDATDGWTDDDRISIS